MFGKKVLIVEDEKHITRLLKYNLEKEGCAVLTAADGASGLACFQSEGPDLIILDIMIPKLDGFEFCKLVRRESQVPILMLTAKKEEVDRVLGLELGADDYVTKPFSVREVLARLKAILRRATDKDGPSSHVKPIDVDLERYEVRVHGKSVALSPKEFDFLKHLLQADGRALTRDQILEKVWGYDRSMDIDTTTVDQHIARLRSKLGKESPRIVTVKNVGYRLKMD